LKREALLPVWLSGGIKPPAPGCAKRPAGRGDERFRIARPQHPAPNFQTQSVPRFLPLFFLLLLAGCGSQEKPPDVNQGPTSPPALVPHLQSFSDAQNQAASEATPNSTEATPNSTAAPTKPAPNLAAPRRFNGLPLAAVLPSPPSQANLSGARVELLRGQIKRYGLFAAYRELIERAKSAGLFDEAARLNREQAALYRAKGLNDAAIIADNEASALGAQLRLFVQTPVSARSAASRTTNAALEPVTGCYLGAFIDRDEHLGAPFYETDLSQSYRSPEQFFAATGRSLGSQFTYLTYGKPFPRAWANRLKARGTIPQIAWEPTSSKAYSDNARTLGQVRDDEYLRDFARQIRDFDFPVFIRFASEMNGFWTRKQYGWNGDAKMYREKFRLVHRVLHAVAPRVATIWCVNNPPLANAFNYYPGDDGCDWVGVNFYAVPFHEDQISKPAFDENPLALLDPIYARYGARKPIAICEFAASHEANADHKPRPDFAVSRIRLVYGALPLLYPRVKLVDWFNLDTLRFRTPGKTPNNYLLTDSSPVLRAWQSATDNPHFLGSYLALDNPIPPIYVPLGAQHLSSPTTIGVWARSFGGSGTVYLGIDGKSWTRARSGGATYLSLNPRSLKHGPHMLSALLYDVKGRFQGRMDTRFST